MMENFEKVLEEKTAWIDKRIYDFLPKEQGLQKTVIEAMRYSMTAGGKRLRPLMMQEAFFLCHGENREILDPFMAAIEMIHTYSLVHDDLPAMDNDEYRRGKKTTHVVYGEAMAILAGDALLNYAFETALQAFDACKTPDETRRVVRAMQMLSMRAGIYGMLGGQVVDVENTDLPLNKEQIDFIYHLKTGALIQSSLAIGAILAGADTDKISHFIDIGKFVGLAFQIQDDILDITSTTQELGKPVHSDEKNNKTTYVSFKGMDASVKAVGDLSGQAVGLMREMGYENSFLNDLFLYLINRKK